MDSENSVSDVNWTWAMMEPEPTDAERALRDQFVNEYLIDFSPENAARRCGFSAPFAPRYADQFMQEAYVQKRIAQVQTIDVPLEEAEKVDKLRIRHALMREAHCAYNPGSARVAALAKLMTLYGMDRPESKTESVDTRGVMIVPGIASVDDWEKAAMASQAKLAEDARTDIG